MKKTIPAPLTFELEYDYLPGSLNGELLFFHLQVKDDSFKVNTKNNTYDNNVLKESYHGVATEKSILAFIEYPSIENLHSILKITDNSYSEDNKRWFYCFKKDSFDSLLKGEITPPLFFEEGISLQDSYKPFIYSELLSIIQSPNYVILNFPSISYYEHDSYPKQFFNITGELVYLENYFNLQYGSSFCSQVNFWNKKQQSLFIDLLNDDPLINKVNFINKMIELQKNEHLFMQPSFDEFLQQHVESPNENYEPLKTGDLFPLESLLEDPESWKPSPSDSLPIFCCNTIHKYKKAFFDAQDIIDNHIHRHQKNQINTYYLANFLMQEESKIYQKLGINFDVFCDAYFCSKIDDDDDDDDDEYSSRGINKESSQKIKNFILNKNLQLDLVNHNKNSIKRKI